MSQSRQFSRVTNQNPPSCAAIRRIFFPSWRPTLRIASAIAGCSGWSVPESAGLLLDDEQESLPADAVADDHDAIAAVAAEPTGTDPMRGPFFRGLHIMLMPQPPLQASIRASHSPAPPPDAHGCAAIGTCRPAQTPSPPRTPRSRTPSPPSYLRHPPQQPFLGDGPRERRINSGDPALGVQ